MGAVFYIPDFMEIRTPWAFPNCSERWRDNPEDAGDFSPGVGRLPRYAPAYFCRGAALFSPQSRMGWENKTPTSFAKGGSSVYKAEPIDKAEGKKTEKGLGGASCILPQPLRMRTLKTPGAAWFLDRIFVPAGENFLLYWCPMCILIGRGDGHGRTQGEDSHQQGRGQRRGPFQRLPGGAALCLDEEPGYHRERPGSAAAI